MAAKRRLTPKAWSICLLAFHCACAPGAARAQTTSLKAFSIPAKPASEALIDFAVQADISIGGVNACHGLSPGLVGRYSIDDGLARLLAGAGCGFRRVAADTFEVSAAPRSKSAPPQRALPRPPAPKASEPVALPGDRQVVVTTTKRAALIGSLPYAISALDHRQLEDAGAMDVSDVAVQVPGLATTNLGLGRDKLLLRGLSDGAFTGRTQSTVGIYLDDVPITYNAPDPDLQLADVETIEVLRGPQGSLYGGGAMSGVYRIVPRKPELDAWSGYARLGGSLTNGGAPSEEYEGMINAPLIRDDLGVRAVVYKTVEGGYIDASDLRLSNVDQTVRQGGRAALRAAPGADWLVTLSTDYQTIDSKDAQYVTPGGGRLHRANQILENSNNTFSATALNVEHDALWGDVTSTTSFVQHRLDSRSDASNALPLFGQGTPAVGSYEEPIRIKMLAEDLVYTSPNVGRLRWLAGLYAQSTIETTDSIVRAGPSPAETNLNADTLYKEHRIDRHDGAALYGDASYALTDRLTATVGMRLSMSDSATTSDVAAPKIEAERTYAGRTTSAGYQPKVALTYKLAPDETIYALVSEGGRGSGVNTGGQIGTVFATSPTQPGVHRFFGGDKLWNLETGAKLAAFGGRLSLNTALFYDIWTNIQTDQFMPSGLSYTANAGDGRDLGAEFEVIARPTQGLTVQGTALLDRPELTRAKPGFMPGSGLPGVPDVSLSGRTAYRWRVWGDISALVFAEAEYIGRSHLTFNRLNSPSEGGYVLARLSAQLEMDRWRLAFFLSNPANARGNTFAYGNPFNFQQAQEITPERPTTLRATLSRDF